MINSADRSLSTDLNRKERSTQKRAAATTAAAAATERLNPIIPFRLKAIVSLQIEQTLPLSFVAVQKLIFSCMLF
jgi:hypothetical protein